MPGLIGKEVRLPSLCDWEEFISILYTGNSYALRYWFRGFYGPNIEPSPSVIVLKPNPVFYAVETENDAMLDILLENGFSPTRIKDHLQPIHKAAMRNCVGALEILIDKYHVPVDTTSQDRPPLEIALYHLSFNAARFLASRNANVNRVRFNKSLLVSAIVNEKAAIAESLIDIGADVNFYTCGMNGPLLSAVWKNRLDLVRKLYEAGARTDITTDQGHSVLHIALQYQSGISLIRYLIDINTSVCVLSNNGHTPVSNGLNTASAWHVLQWLDLMLEAGHHVTQQDYQIASENFSCDYGKPILEKLQFQLAHPKTLKQQCCIKIRRLLGARLPQTVECLPLPMICQKFIKLDHLLRD